MTGLQPSLSARRLCCKLFRATDYYCVMDCSQQGLPVCCVGSAITGLPCFLVISASWSAGSTVCKGSNDASFPCQLIAMLADALGG